MLRFSSKIMSTSSVMWLFLLTSLELLFLSVYSLLVGDVFSDYGVRGEDLLPGVICIVFYCSTKHGFSYLVLADIF